MEQFTPTSGTLVPEHPGTFIENYKAIRKKIYPQLLPRNIRFEAQVQLMHPSLNRKLRGRNKNSNKYPTICR